MTGSVVGTSITCCARYSRGMTSASKAHSGPVDVARRMHDGAGAHEGLPG